MKNQMSNFGHVRNICKSTMNGGQMFEAQVDGIKFMVTIPQNGINQGELFTVPYPTTTATIGPMATAGGNYNDRVMDNVANAHNGTWRTDLFDCFYSNSNGCFCLCLMGFCCTHILMAQLMQRMKYNLGGVPVHVNNDGNTRRPICGYEYVCIVISIATICIYIALYVLSYYEINIGYILFLSGWFIYLIIISTCTRYSMRQKYNIKSQCCNNNGDENSCCGGMEDCCTVSWCSCCSAVQMISHTHDGRKYPYQGCNQTGIDMYAPDCVVGVV
jgi:Cys-rich protein (TIGR01571 family)